MTPEQIQASYDEVAAAMVASGLERMVPKGGRPTLETIRIMHEAVVKFGDMRSRGSRGREVGVREFIESPEYMDARGVVWPAVMDERYGAGDERRSE